MNSKVHNVADERKYKFCIYVVMNTDLSKSPFIDLYHPSADIIVKFRLGSHHLPIETSDERLYTESVSLVMRGMRYMSAFL